MVFVKYVRNYYGEFVPVNWPSLVQILACRLVGAKSLADRMLPYFQLYHKEHISMKFYLKFNFFFEENAPTNDVCEMVAILFWPQCIKSIHPCSYGMVE